LKVPLNYLPGERVPVYSRTHEFTLIRYSSKSRGQNLGIACLSSALTLTCDPLAFVEGVSLPILPS
jgi:hypothetical protein